MLRVRCRENLPGYQCWTSMNSRCRNPNRESYRRYGGRGITVCPEWQGRGGYERFIAHIGPRPSPKHQIDRIDNDGNYEPGNVRWVLPAVNWKNRSEFRRKLTCRGKTKTIVSWAAESGVHADTIARRLKLGCGAEEAIFTPIKPRVRRDYGEPASGPTRDLLSALPIGGSVFLRVSRQRVQQLAVELGMRFHSEVLGKCVNVTRLDNDGARSLARLRAVRYA